jgi:nicotinate-nucleotide adenylyltransferase
LTTVAQNGAPAQANSPIALLGGTFDPVHYGHLRLADDVRRALDLHEVRLVPSATPPHRAPTQASAADRIAMLDLAVRGFPGLVVDTREVARGGRSYTVDTLAALRAEVETRPLVLLVGADAFRGLPAWHRFRELFDLAHLVVVPRPGITLADNLPPELVPEWEARHVTSHEALRAAPAGSIYVQPVTPNPVSSTQIRNAVTNGDAKSIAALVPPQVLAYIESHRLYSQPTGTDTHRTHAS